MKVVSQRSINGSAMGALLLLLGFWAMLGSTVRGADHLNLEEGLPTELEDAYPIAFRGREFQTQVQFERTDGGKDRFVIDPRFEFGIARNAQAKISVPFFLGDADQKDSGNIGLEGFYNFNTEGIWLPAFATSLRLDFPTGRHASGVDTTLKGLVTKSITKTGLDRVHLNMAWKHNDNGGAGPMVRDDLFHVVFGYSRRVGADTVVVADYVWEQDRVKGKTADILEIGLRRQITPLTLVSVGLGAGITKDSPDLRATIGLQKSF